MGVDRWRAIQNPWWEHPDTVAWRENVAAQIEALRAAEAPLRCPTCDSSAYPPPETRDCPTCGLTKPLTAYPRNHKRANGRGYECGVCRAAYLREYRRRQKVTQFRQIVREVAS